MLNIKLQAPVLRPVSSENDRVGVVKNVFQPGLRYYVFKYKIRNEILLEQ